MTAVKSRREEHSDSSRTALLDSATHLFAERGYAGTTLDEIASAARMTKGALYWHFQNKQGVFRAVLERLEEAVVQRLTVAALEPADPWEGTLAGVRTFLDAACDPVYGRVVMREGPVALSYSDWRECEDKYSYGLIRALLERLIQAGVIADVPVDTGARIAHGLLGTAAVLIAETDDDENQARVRGEAEDIVLRLMQGFRRTGPAGSG